MGKHSLCAALALLAACPALAASPAPTAGQRVFPVAATPVVSDHYPARQTQWPGGVTSLADVTYSTLPGYRPLVIDIYMPPKHATPKPLVLYIHGGGWVGGHTRHGGALANFPAALARLASEGFVVASLEYRLAAEAPFPAQVQDVRAALRVLKANAATSLDAPGTTAPAASECVQAAAIWYGGFDCAALAAGRPGGQDAAGAKLLACQGPCSPEKTAAASPNTYIDPRDPPFLLIHGEADKTVPVGQSLLGEAKLKAAHVPVDTIIIPGVDHSFIGQTPQETTQATLRAINATFDFLHQQLDKKVGQ